LPAGPSSFTHLSKTAALFGTKGGVLIGWAEATRVSACGSIAKEPYTLTFEVNELSGAMLVTKSYQGKRLLFH